MLTKRGSTSIIISCISNKGMAIILIHMPLPLLPRCTARAASTRQWQQEAAAAAAAAAVLGMQQQGLLMLMLLPLLLLLPRLPLQI